MKRRTMLALSALALLAAHAAGCGSIAPAWMDPGPRGRAPELNVPIQHYRLANGFSVTLAPREMHNEFAAKLVYPVGIAEEPADKNGLRFLAFLTMLWPYEVNARTAERAGIWWDPLNIQPDLTALDLVGGTDNLESAVMLYARAFAAERLSESNFSAAKAKLLEDRDERKERRGAGLDDVLYEGEPYANKSNVGTAADLRTITFDEARAFASTWLGISNATLCIMGNFDPAAARDMIERHFGALPASPAPPAIDWKHPAPKGPREKDHEGNQPGEYKYLLAYETPPTTTPDNVPLTMLGEVLSLRVDAAIGKHYAKPFTTNVQWRSRWGPSYFLMSVTLKEEAFDIIGPVIAAEAEAIKTTPPTREEYDRACENLTQGAALYYVSSPYHESWWHPAPLRDLYATDINHVGRYHRIWNLDPAELSRMARTYFTEERRFTIRSHPKPAAR